MGRRTCEDCKKSRADVCNRQGDLMLCQPCNDLRFPPSKLPNKSMGQTVLNTLLSTPNRIRAGLSSTTPSTVLDTAMIEPELSVMNSKTDNNHPKSLCSKVNCKGNINEPLCKCTVCAKLYHLTCANLKKQPAKTTKWVCSECKDFHMIMKNLQTTVTSLTSKLKDMNSKQEKMFKTQQELRKENLMLKNDQQKILQNQEALQTENVLLRSELDELKKQKTPEQVIIQPPENNTIPESLKPSGTLIIGDSILKVLHKKTFENAKIHAISGARMLDIFRELNCISDLKNFKNIIIHAGTNDIDNGTPTNEIVESMEAILTLLLVEAPMADVFVSAICPRVDKSFDTEIRHLNESLRDLTSRYDIHFIDAGQNMTYRNGTIDASQLSDGLHLSKRGKETLIREYSDSVKSLKLSTRTWSDIARDNSRQSGKNLNRNGQERSKSEQIRNREPHPHHNQRPISRGFRDHKHRKWVFLSTSPKSFTCFTTT